MYKLSTRHRNIAISLLLISLIATALWFCDVRDLCAHSPHDPIDALEISPTYDQDKTLFIVISDYVLRSTDAGFSWKALVNGLDNKHLLSSIAISPSYHSDRTLFISSNGDGVYRSQDGGDSWSHVSNGIANLDIGLISVYSGYHSRKLVLAAGTEEGLYKTENGGDSWQQVMDDSVRVSAIAFSPDSEKDLILVGDHRGILYTSTDRGKTWQRTRPAWNTGAITAIAISPSFASDNTFFIGTERGGILRTDDGGDSFIEITEGLRFTIQGKYGTFRTSKDGPIIRRDEKDVVSIALSPHYASDSTVFISMWNEAVFKSEDGGSTWERYPIGLTCDFQADSAEYKSPHFRAVRISNNFESDGTVFLAGFDGLFKSTDGGQHWAQMETLPVKLIKGLALSPGSIDDLSIAITTYGSGACTTDNQGDTWAINNSGLETTRLSGIVFSPNYPIDATLFSASRGYLLRSTDRGNTWDKTVLSYSTSETTTWRRRIYSILGDLGIPSFVRRQVLARTERESPFATVFAISPNFASDSTIYFGTRYHGVFKSVDGGIEASAVWDGMGRTITSLAISPDFASDGTLFASVRGAGTYKTVDGGSTWQPANNGLTFIEQWQSPTVHDIAKKDIQLAISPYYKVDKTVFAACSEGLFKTTDGGDDWQPLKDTAYGEEGYIIGIAISPDYEDDATLIVSVRGKGLFETQNAGITFSNIGPDLIDNNYAIEYLMFSESYATDNTIYAASDEELFRSKDGGHAWEMITHPARYENMREVVHYEGEWTISEGDDFSASSVSHSEVAHSKAALSFVGTGISWIGTESSDHGIARVYIDGQYMDDVDQFSDTSKTMVRLFSVTNLAYGPHTIVVEVTDTKNPESTGYHTAIDAFDVIP